MYDSGGVKRTRFISITPRILRTIADQIEQASKSQFFNPNESVYVDVSEGLTLYYEPSLDGIGVLPQISSQAEKRILNETNFSENINK